MPYEPLRIDLPAYPIVAESTAVNNPEAAGIAEVVQKFPAILNQARSDWGKFNAGVARNLFSGKDKTTVLDWFGDLPKLWDGIKGNWRTDSAFYRDTEQWINKLRTHPSILFPGLGIAPLIIAGVIIAAAFGVAGSIWGIAYIKKQANITRLINETVAGRLAPAVLQEAVAQEASLNPFGGIGSTLKTVVIGGILFMVLKEFGPGLAKSIQGSR